ncbi:anti-phage deoxyguanosine triphosphatase [Paenibacillus marchantiae]|uniref:anti-phage deoxyguanosine triphosphatase n=1 Tax=Paenibacillus marchantiae TaxID=3026433 RepID=UPI00237C2238|nr:anti-phage deoxyguanosine triphosphatase [Paenibacillus marchantiae]WDQ33628.1 anti-phage deoxyguanosine triphosphatase [Paenibacillus marchantiae]
MIQGKLNSNILYNKYDIQRIKELPVRSGHPARDDFERDYSRVVHSAAFRRLQSKTQVIGIGEGDFHRTRLTHSMEVAQIARGIVLSLNAKSKVLNREYKQIDSSLIEAAALAHDFGHPPFGHQGERALNEMMFKKDKSGFEGNAQTLRILTRLERGVGLNLTRATLLAILKYPIKFDEAVNENRYTDFSNFDPPKSNIYPEDSNIFDWLLLPFNKEERELYLNLKEKVDREHRQTCHKTFECSVIELADDIAYATHDLEDAMRLDFIKIEEVISILKKYSRIDGVEEVIRKFEKEAVGHISEKIKDATADLISIFIMNVKVSELDEIKHARLRYYAFHDDEIKNLIKAFKKLVYNNVIRLPRVQTIEWKGGHIIREMFTAFFDETKLLPIEDQELIQSGQNKARVVCDYIAGMTDSYALKMFSRLFEARESRLFDI